METFVQQILSKWEESGPSEGTSEAQKKEIDILSFVHKTNPKKNTEKQYSLEELRIRNQILNQYSQVINDAEKIYD